MAEDEPRQLQQEIEDVQNQLAALQIRKDYLERRARELQQGGAGRPPAVPQDIPLRVGGFAIGDRVRFHGTQVTAGGTGTVIAFTGTPNSPGQYLKIRADDQDRRVVQRKPHKVEAL